MNLYDDLCLNVKYLCQALQDKDDNIDCHTEAIFEEATRATDLLPMRQDPDKKQSTQDVSY